MVVSHNQGVAFNALAYGAFGDGVHDDTQAIQAAINACAVQGPGTVLLPGNHCISGPLTISSPRIVLQGLGRGTGLTGLTNFSGTAFVVITADFCAVQDMTLSYVNTTTASNPSNDGILVSGARHCHLRNLEGYYLNGYLSQIVATASLSSAGAIVESIHVYECAGGFHLLGNTAQGFAQQTWMSDLNIERVTTLDGILVEDANDVLIVNFGGAADQGAASNSALHIKGACSSVFVVSADIGVTGTANAPTVLIETGPNGSPSRVTFIGGVVQAGTYCIRATAGTNFLIHGTQFRAWTLIGLSLEFAGAMYAVVDNCEFTTSSTGAGSGRYDINIGNSSARVTIIGCLFRDTIGASAGQVNATMNLAGGRVYVMQNDFEGATTIAQAFQGSVEPGLLVENTNINPVGSITVTPSGSPFTVPAQPMPTNYYVTGGTVTAITIGGVATGLTAGAFLVPVGATMVITYTGAPTVTGYGA